MPKDLLNEKEITLEKLREQFQNKDFTQTALKPYSVYSAEEIEFHSEIRSYIHEHWIEILKDFGIKNPMSCFSKDYPLELIREYLERLTADIVISIERDEIAFENIWNTFVIELKGYGVTIEIKRSSGQRFILLNYDRKSDSSDGCHLWVEIAVTAVTPIVTNALPMRIFDSDGSFESDGTTAK